MNNFNNIFSLYSQFKQNPLGILQKRFNIPGNIQEPNDIIQHLLNTNQVSQGQVNQIMRMRNNPMLQALLKR